MTFDLDAACKEALDRMEARANERHAIFERQAKERYHFHRRSISQMARRILEQLRRGK